MAGLWELDRAIFRAIHLGWHQPWLDPVFWVISTSGLGYVQGPLLLLLLPSVRRRVRLPVSGPDVAWFWGAVFSFAVPGLGNGLFKQFLPRERPSNFVWTVPQEQFFGDSFASGHTATSCGLGFYFFLMTRGTRWSGWGWAALLWGLAVGVSRIYRGVHWPTDVVAGALEGLLAASLATYWASGRSSLFQEADA